MNPTQEACIYGIAKMHPFKVSEIKELFELCKSIDDTIKIVEVATQTAVSLIDMFESIKACNTAGIKASAAGSKMQDILLTAQANSKFNYKRLLKKEDLVNLVKGTSPSYDLFDNETVKRCGTYNGSYGTWSWKEHKLERLSDHDLYELYTLCRDAYK